jgi:hypothetical protein
MLKGEFMKKYGRSFVAFTLLLGLGVAANAETRGVQVSVELPFKFVAGGRTLPAGAYTVKRNSDQPFGILLITSRDTGTSVFVNPSEMEDASDYKPNLTFDKVGDQHFLSAIQTENYVYTFPVPRSVTLAAAAKPNDTVSVSVSGGSK